MAGLVSCGYTGPWRWNALDWELTFYQAWDDWEARLQFPELFPKFAVGGTGTRSQGRDMLRQLKPTSPFASYHKQELPNEPFGLPPAEYLEIWVEGAAPDQWIDLAGSFLERMGGKA